MHPAPVPVLRLEGISKSFGRVAALGTIDLTVEQGQVVCLIGPSGCGKSTLLRCINFLVEPDQGRVSLDGEPMGFVELRGRRRRDREANINRMRSKIGMVFQNFNVWPHLTALDNVVLPQVRVSHRSHAEAKRRALDLLARVSLSEKSNAYPAQLSGGQLQRVAIARALALDPVLLLFDEPTSALDPELVTDVLAVIRGLAASGRTMMIVTHELRLASEVADRVVFMEAGQIVEQGSPLDLLQHPRSERLQQFLSSRLHHDRGGAGRGPSVTVDQG
jgi:polar amino acid transport system ATP-binding protein